MATNEVPPWGTPDGGAPDPEVPAPGPPGSGTSGRRTPEPGAPGSGTSGSGTSGSGTSGSGTSDVPDYGTPPPAAGRPQLSRPARRRSPGPDLLTATTVVVVETDGFLSSGAYKLITPDDVRLGTLRREASAAGFLLGGAATTTYRLYDERDRQIGSMTRPGSLGGRSRFVISNARDAEIGTVEQENRFGAPVLLLTTADNLTMRLSGDRFGSREWQLTDGLDDSVLMGQVSQEYAGLIGMINDSHRFAVQLSPQLAGDHRLLAVMATVCLDHIRDARRG